MKKNKKPKVDTSDYYTDVFSKGKKLEKIYDKNGKKIEIEGEHITGSETGRSDSVNLTISFVFSLRPVADLHLTICRQIKARTIHFLQLNFSPTSKVEALTVQEIYFPVECFWMDRQNFSDAA